MGCTERANSAPSVSRTSRLGGVSYRFTQVSKRHGDKRFSIQVALEDFPDVAPLRSVGTMVFSKRKNPNARMEAQVRHAYILTKNPRLQSRSKTLTLKKMRAQPSFFAGQREEGVRSPRKCSVGTFAGNRVFTFTRLTAGGIATSSKKAENRAKSCSKSSATRGHCARSGGENHRTAKFGPGFSNIRFWRFTASYSFSASRYATFRRKVSVSSILGKPIR